MSSQPLKKITSITILDETYDLAKNGDHFHLVEHKEPDAYARPVARQVNLYEWILFDSSSEIKESPRAQELVNILGATYLRITILEDELSKAHNALQREAEPDSKPRRPISVRENSMGIESILDDGRIRQTPEVKGEAND